MLRLWPSPWKPSKRGQPLQALQSELPQLRRVYFSVLEDEKQSALEAVEQAEDGIHVAENRRDALDRRRLLLRSTNAVRIRSSYAMKR